MVGPRHLRDVIREAIKQEAKFIAVSHYLMALQSNSAL